MGISDHSFSLFLACVVLSSTLLTKTAVAGNYLRFERDVQSTTEAGMSTTAWIDDESPIGDGEKILDSELTKVLDSIINKSDMRIRPNAQGPPVVVNTNLRIVAGFSTVAATMDYNLMVFIRQRWNDPRLQYNGTSGRSLSVSPSLANKIWVPDMFFINEKSGKLHDLTVKNEALRIYPRGDILLSMRLSLTLACNMDLRKYPMDVQLCHLTMESYGYRTKDMIMTWTKTDPVEIDESIEIAEFKDPTFKTIAFNKTYTTGNFSALRAYFLLRRIYDYHLIQTFIPTAVYVIISWLSFWINPEAAPARVALGITTVLTVTSQGTGVRNGLPSVAYVKVIDVWMTMCLGFVFAALIEYALVNYLLTEGKRRKELAKNAEKEKKSGEGGIEKMEVESPENGKSEEGDESKVYFLATWLVTHVRPVTVEKVSRIAFPVAFLIFNILYWPISFSNYYDNLLTEIDD
ncbi:glycine receptor subunit alpha-2-like isoform X2 [Glandiceps talaboti]